MAQSNFEIVKGLYDAFSLGDIETVLDALDPQVEWRFADNFIYADVNPVIGREALRAGSLRKLATEWEGFASPLDELIDGGEQVIGLGHYTGTYKATGRSIQAQFAHVWTLAGGKVVRWRQYVDTKQIADAAARASDHDRRGEGVGGEKRSFRPEDRGGRTPAG